MVGVRNGAGWGGSYPDGGTWLENARTRRAVRCAVKRSGERQRVPADKLLPQSTVPPTGLTVLRCRSNRLHETGCGIEYSDGAKRSTGCSSRRRRGGVGHRGAQLRGSDRVRDRIRRGIERHVHPQVAARLRHPLRGGRGEGRVRCRDRAPAPGTAARLGLEALPLEMVGLGEFHLPNRWSCTATRRSWRS